MSVVVTIYRGNTFLMTDPWGEISGQAIHGFFHQGLRFLSRYEILINGEGTFLLTSRAVGNTKAVYYLSNIVDGLPEPCIHLILRRSIDRGLRDHLILRNYCPEALDFNLAINLDADFEDMYRVKAYLWQEKLQPQSPIRARRAINREDRRLSWICLPWEDGPKCDATIHFDRPFDLTPEGVSFALHLKAWEEWDISMVLEPRVEGRGEPWEGRRVKTDGSRRGRERSISEPSPPILRTDGDLLLHAYREAIRDLDFLQQAALDASGDPHLLAAGIPWFIYLFGRDSLITSYQTLPFAPEVAIASLRALARYQGSHEDPARDMEPGKIPHQLPFSGDFQREIFRFPYYGSVDATPLFLIVLSETWRWTGDDRLARDLREPAERALDWIHTADRHGDGYVHYIKRAQRGLTTQGWKDSADSIIHSDGRIATPPIALVEVQAYTYDAKVRTAELAEEVWHERALAQQLEGEARDLRDRFNRDFWIPRRGGMYAMALDGNERPADALGSNLGHALWCGIVPEDRAARCANLLLSPGLFSGWGIRTLASDEAGYHPVKYHRGTVWPWDTSIAAMGLARYGLKDESLQLIQGLVEVSPYFDHGLPELLAGYGRNEEGSPVSYPTACQPQAWSAGSILLALRVLMGMQPDRNEGSISLDPALPEGVGWLEIQGLRAFGQGHRARIADGEASVAPS